MSLYVYFHPLCLHRYLFLPLRHKVFARRNIGTIVSCGVCVCRSFFLVGNANYTQIHIRDKAHDTSTAIHIECFGEKLTRDTRSTHKTPKLNTSKMVKTRFSRHYRLLAIALCFMLYVIAIEWE